MHKSILLKHITDSMLPESLINKLCEYVASQPGEIVNDSMREVIADIMDIFADFYESSADALEEYSDKLAELEDKLAYAGLDWEMEKMDSEIAANREAAHAILMELKKSLSQKSQEK